MLDALLGLIAYLMGAFPSAYVFGRLIKGIDIRYGGSGNVGGINAVRQAGFIVGFLTIITDIGKGFLAVSLAAILGSSDNLMLMAAFLSVFGHNFNPFLAFKGGKGLATTLGAFLVLNPLTALYTIVLMFFCSLLLRDTNTGAGVGVALIPLVFWTQHAGWSYVIMGAAIALIIVVKHINDFRSYAAGRRKLI